MNTTDFSTRHFTYSKACGTFATEASDLDDFQLSEVFCAASITLVSARTGLRAAFEYDRTDRDVDGDISAWVFVPSRETLIDHPHLHETSVIIFND